MLGFYSISEQAASGASSGGAGSSGGRGGGSGGGGRFGATSGPAKGGPAHAKGHKHKRHIDHSPMPPDYWSVRAKYLYRKKKESEDDLPQNE